MISISFFLHPNRKENLKTIHNAYKDYDIVDEVLIVTGKEVDTTGCNPKFKFVLMPGPYTYGAWPSFGLLSRYTFALSCKNRFVFMQDDDFVYNELTMQKMYDLQQPITGCHYRWFYDDTYKHKPQEKKQNTADIILTGGTLVDTHYLPDVIKYAKKFFIDYQDVFNGEDIFMSRAISHITGQDKFQFVKDSFEELSSHNVQLTKKVNKKGSRSKITQDVYRFFENINE